MNILYVLINACSVSTFFIYIKFEWLLKAIILQVKTDYFKCLENHIYPVKV